MIDAFISYAHKDAARVGPLVHALQDEGCRVWWDRDISPGRNFEREIEKALDDAACVLILLTRNAAGSEWIQGEYAFGQEYKKVIPVLLDDVRVPVPLRSLKVADLRGWPESERAGTEFRELVASLEARAAGQSGPAQHFVGREEALGLLQKGFSRMLRGAGGVVMVAGEPGIGKTRCAEEFTQAMEDQGALVLWGRCFEQSGTPPYWPWVQVLREYAAANSDDELRMVLAHSGDAIAALVPELAERLGIEARSSTEMPKPENAFRVFDAVARLLERHAREVPLALVIDDLHWADESSLALLEFIVRSLRQQRLFIICTYRDAEVTRKSLLLATLGELARSRNVQRIRLSGLDPAETARLVRSISGTDLGTQVIEAIYRQTDGNPLFVEEVARGVAAQHAASPGGRIIVDVPDGIREAIGRRLDRLSSRCNELLAIASVLGREFDLKVVVKVLGISLEAAVEELSEAMREGLVGSRDSGPAAFRFTHAVIRETVYDELPTLERLRHHQRVAAALMEIHGNRLDPVLSQLVHHCVEASALGDFEPAVGLALRAAEHDLRVYALEDACRHYDQAVRTLLENGRADDPRVAQAYFRKGKVALTAGKIPEGIESLSRGADLARSQGDALLFTDCTLALVLCSSHLPQHRTVPLLKEALALLPESDLPRRAAALANLAFASRTTSSTSEVLELGRQALELARAADEPAVLANALRFLCMGLRGDAKTLPDRLRYGSEALEASGSVDDPEEVAECSYWHLLDLVEAGHIAEAEALLERYAHHASAHHLYRHQYQARLLRAQLSLLHGEWKAAEKLVELALEQGRKLNRQEAEGVHGAQMFQLNRDLGRLRMMRPVVESLLEHQSSELWEPGLMLTCLEVGLEERARAALDAVAGEDFSAVPRDDMWLICMVFCAEACVRLGDKRRGAVLYGLLEPYRDQTANHPTAICLGAVASHLGRLGALVGDAGAARGHLEAGIARNREMKAWPALARSLFWLAQLLAGADSDEQREEGRKLLADAEQLAARFSMAGLAEEINGLSEAAAENYPDGLTRREIEVLRLIAMGRSNKDISLVLSISLSTVATHVRSILGKTGCANRTEAAAYANRHELN